MRAALGLPPGVALLPEGALPLAEPLVETEAAVEMVQRLHGLPKGALRSS